MLLTNAYAQWTTITDKFTASGKPVLGATKRIPVASVRLREGVKTSDKNEGGSGSQGRGVEETVVARILVPSRYNVKVGDKLVIGSIDLKCSLVWPHYNNFGQLDHYEIDGVAWV